jgi:hypothetical protein
VLALLRASGIDGRMNVLVLGATGTAGGSVLRACLAASHVREVRAIVRRPVGLEHDKLRTFQHDDFLALGPVAEAFAGLDAVLFCVGVSATQVPDEVGYRRVTQAMALASARMMKARSPNAAFHYLSGMGANRRSRLMWARVKAEAERDVTALVGAVCWRPALIHGEDSTSAPWFVRAARPLGMLLRPFTSLSVEGEELGLAMLRATEAGMRSHVLENRAIRRLGGPGGGLREAVAVG